MSRLMKTYIPALTLNFTIIILFACVVNVVQGYDKEGFCFFILGVMGYLIIALAIDYFLSMINFKKYIHYFVVETILLYPAFLVAAGLGKWFHITTLNVLSYFCIFLIIMAVIHYYIYTVSKKQAEEINAILNQSNR